LLPEIWNALRPGGVLFLNQTPHRYFPIETHTTAGLPFVNYLPDKLACYYARHFARTKLRNFTWDQLLRKGIRGGSVGEVLNILHHGAFEPVLLDPIEPGVSDRIDLWYAKSGGVRLGTRKRLFWWLAKTLKVLTGAIVVPSLSLAIRKADRVGPC
jgi:hypothetical protein